MHKFMAWGAPRFSRRDKPLEDLAPKRDVRLNKRCCLQTLQRSALSKRPVRAIGKLFS